MRDASRSRLRYAEGVQDIGKRFFFCSIFVDFRFFLAGNKLSPKIILFDEVRVCLMYSKLERRTFDKHVKHSTIPLSDSAFRYTDVLGDLVSIKRHDPSASISKIRNRAVTNVTGLSFHP